MLEWYRAYGLEEEYLQMQACEMCPHRCGADRFNAPDGICATDASLNVASVIAHHGEEPPISGTHGICNVFFRHCNLACSYCQNHQISARGIWQPNPGPDLETVVSRICQALDDGCASLGFVTPSHLVPQMLLLINIVRSRGYDPVIVYNTNAYDLPHRVEALSAWVDVWLPDFKYADRDLACRWSGVRDYPEVALAAIRRMHALVGNGLPQRDGVAIRGIILRHLVLPGETANSVRVLEMIREHLGDAVHLSLMAQYHPTVRVAGDSQLGRTLFREEYDEVVGALHRLGFHRGWIQSMDSPQNYLPDFELDAPFSLDQ